MKKRIWVAVFALLCAFGLSLTLLRPRAEKEIKVCALLNGSIQDRSYTQAQYEALAAACEKLGLDLAWFDKVPFDDSFPAMARRVIEDGYRVIVCDHYLYEPYLIELAAAYPHVYFLNASGTESAQNYASYLGRMYQARYLSGLVAGAQTETGQIGYVLAFLTPETIRQLNAFTIGVRKTNPDAHVYVRRINDWNSAEKAASVTSMLLDAHNVDVLTLHVNTISPLRVADKCGVYTIGNNYDNRELFPDTYLTACVFDWEPFFEERLSECVRGQFVGRHYWEGLRSGLVALSPLTELVSDSTRRLVNAELGQLMNGTFDVFFGPVTDIYGTVQVREHENLSDRELLYGMYWFVDGVIME